MSQLDQIRFVVDENLLRLGRALVQLRSDIACCGLAPLDLMFPLGRLDPEWIPEIGSREWVVITDDRHIRTRPDEAKLAEEHKLKVVHLDGMGHRRRWDQLIRLVSHWEKVEAMTTTRPNGPWWLALRANRAIELPYRPGTGL